MRQKVVWNKARLVPRMSRYLTRKRNLGADGMMAAYHDG